jgi:hypothetical protein
VYEPVNQPYLSSFNRFIFALLLCWGLSVAATPVYADKVPRLYEASIPVHTQSREERNDAIRTAFTEVLVRVSGRTDIVNADAFPGVATAIDTATRYAQQFRFYRANPVPTDPEKPKLVLWVRFDEKAISRLLRSNQLPVWGDTRPATLVWLVIDNRGQRTLIGNDTKNDSKALITEQAQLRGLPLRFPLLDLTDRQNLNVSDVWGNFESTILHASERYQTEAVLVGRVYQGYSGSWTGRWSLYSDGRRQDWSLTETELARVLMPGIDKTVESLAVRYAQVGHSEDNEVLVLVKDIKGLPDYNRTVKYLQELSHVSKVNPYQVEQNSAMFRVTAAGGRLTLARSVSLGDVLVAESVSSVPLTDPVPDAGEKPDGAKEVFTALLPDLTYRLVP